MTAPDLRSDETKREDARVARNVAAERERIAKFVENMDDGPITTKAVKSWIARAIREGT